MRVLLYNPPSSAGRKPIVPCSLLALAALLEDRHEWSLLDGNLQDGPTWPAMASAVRAERPDVVAMTVMPGPQLADAIPNARRLKAEFPGVTVVWGGYFPSQHHDVVLQDGCVDYVVRGHGEQAFLDLLDQLDAGTHPVQGRSGIAWRDGPADRGVDEGLPPIPHPDKQPGYPWHRLPMQRYLRPTFLGRTTIGHHSSYGCPFFCNFCAVVNMVDGAWLSRSAQTTADDVRTLVQTYGADAVEFYDNNFFVAEKRCRAFADAIADLGIRWWGEGRIDTMLGWSDDTWRAMADSGLAMVFMGAEAGDDETLARMNKGGKQTTAATLELAARMARFGVVPEYSFVLGSPPDPEADVERTLRFVRRVKEANPATEVVFYLYTPVPLEGTLLESAKATGFAFPTTLEGWLDADWQGFSQRRSESMPWISPALRERVRGFELTMNAAFPTSTDVRNQGLRARSLRAMGRWRWEREIYDRPLELKVASRLMRYRRPETSGF
ncbi:MAG: hypothetical protein RIT45_389 [Pseudomonadota bacterium]